MRRWLRDELLQCRGKRRVVASIGRVDMPDAAVFFLGGVKWLETDRGRFSAVIVAAFAGCVGLPDL